jgi:hypothetical protein
VPQVAVVVGLDPRVRFLVRHLHRHGALRKRRLDRALQIALLFIRRTLCTLATSLADLEQSRKWPSWLELLAPHILGPQKPACGLLPLVWPPSIAWIDPSVLLTRVFLHVS